MNSLMVTENEAQANAIAPRVSLNDICQNIAERYDLTGADAVGYGAGYVVPIDSPLHHFSLCILVMKNGFVVIGKSAPASPENFNAELGKKFAYEDAVRQLWPLMGYALRNKLAGI